MKPEEYIGSTENIEAILIKLKSEYNKLPREKERILTIPVIFGKTYDENFISDYLAYILNPVINGFGIGPIKSLLKHFRIGIPVKEYYKQNEVEVIREFTFENRRRIDILIKLEPDILIAIENKIFSGEREKQTLNYEESIKKKFSKYNCVLIYLSRSENIFPSSPNFYCISYNKLIQILKETLSVSVYDYRSLFLYVEFILHIEEYIMQNKNFELSQKTLLFLEHYDMLQTIYDSFINDSIRVFNNICEIIKQSYLEIYPDFEFKFDKNKNYQQVYKKSWNSYNDILIHFEFWFDSKSILIKDKIQFMIDVEGKRKEEFFKKFDNIFIELEKNFNENGLSYKPNNRENALAYKEYKISFTQENLNTPEIRNIFNKMLKDFEFIIPKIDEIISEI